MARRTKATNVRVDTDDTGGLFWIDWTCPYCGEFNAGFHFSTNSGALRGDFETDQECEGCGKTVVVECRGAGPLF